VGCTPERTFFFTAGAPSSAASVVSAGATAAQDDTRLLRAEALFAPAHSGRLTPTSGRASEMQNVVRVSIFLSKFPLRTLTKFERDNKSSLGSKKNKSKVQM
jgi:hypothetical protein